MEDEIVGLETGNFEDFESFDEVLEAYLKQQKKFDPTCIYSAT